MEVIIIPLLQVISTLISVYTWAIILAVILSWLITYKMINAHHPLINTAYDILRRITDPALQWVRRMIPPLNGIDLSPVALILGLYLVQSIILQIAARM